MSIGKRISELRKQKNLSQEYIAEKLGVSRQAVSKWEQDLSAPDTYNLIALAELLGVTVEYIAMGKKEESSESVQPAVHEKTSGRIIAGSILLGAGLLSFIIGILLSGILLFVSIYLIVAGGLMLAVKKNTAIAVSLGMAVLWSFMFSFIFGRVYVSDSMTVESLNVNVSEEVSADPSKGEVTAEIGEVIPVSSSVVRISSVIFSVGALLWGIAIALIVIYFVKRSKQCKRIKTSPAAPPSSSN